MFDPPPTGADVRATAGGTDDNTALRTTGLLTAGRNPWTERTPPAAPWKDRLPGQAREVFGDFHRCSRQPEYAGIAGLGHELTLLPRAGLSGRIRPAGRDGTGDGRGEELTAGGLQAERAEVEQGELPRRGRGAHGISGRRPGPGHRRPGQSSECWPMAV